MAKKKKLYLHEISIRQDGSEGSTVLAVIFCGAYNMCRLFVYENAPDSFYDLSAMASSAVVTAIVRYIRGETDSIVVHGFDTKTRDVSDIADDMLKDGTFNIWSDAAYAKDGTSFSNKYVDLKWN